MLVLMDKGCEYTRVHEVLADWRGVQALLSMLRHPRFRALHPASGIRVHDPGSRILDPCGDAGTCLLAHAIRSLALV